MNALPIYFMVSPSGSGEASAQMLRNAILIPTLILNELISGLFHVSFGYCIKWMIHWSVKLLPLWKQTHIPSFLMLTRFAYFSPNWWLNFPSASLSLQENTPASYCTKWMGHLWHLSIVQTWSCSIKFSVCVFTWQQSREKLGDAFSLARFFFLQ